jgi:hypothetical protein
MGAAIAGWVLLGLGALSIASYWLSVASRRPDEGVSAVPLLGGGLAFGGCALIPAIGWKLGQFAFVVDPGCWFPVALPIGWMIRRLRRAD